MAEQVSIDSLNAVTLDNQQLLYEPLPKETTETVGQICGLNAQSARSPYISLWNRIQGFTKKSLTEATYVEKTLIKAWLMRGTVHIIRTVDFPVYQKALRQTLCEQWERSLRKQTAVDLPRNWSRLLDAVTNSLGDGPLTKGELLARLKGLIMRRAEKEQKRLLSWALRSLTYKGTVCHGRPTGSWYHFQHNRFALVSDWLDSDHVESMDEDDARHDLLIKYIGGYGPATIKDFAYWAGLRLPVARKTLEAARRRLCPVKVEGSKAAYWALEGQCNLLQDSPEPPYACFLPEFDPLIMGHADKSRIIDEKHRKHVFLRLGAVAPTILANGRVAGTWRYSFTDGSFETSPFENLSGSVGRNVQTAAEGFKDFLHG